MKQLSGEFLSRVLWTLQQCNATPRTPEEVRTMLLGCVASEALYVDLADGTTAVPVRPAPRRATAFDSDNWDRLNALLPWSSFELLGDGRALGSAWSQRKRHTASPQPDPRVQALHGKLALTGMSVLELGCFEGHHSISLAAHCKEVWAVDGRIENVIKTLVRVWMDGVDDRVTANLLDLERDTLRQQLIALGRDAPFDLIHHRGVLYHLSNPVAHLAQCSEVCTKYLYLHTQAAHEAQADVVLHLGGSEYPAYRYQEPPGLYAPFAGITSHAHWLTEPALTRLLGDVGFVNIEVLARGDERNGLRLELIASK